MSQDATTARRAVDPTALAIAGATTLGWYAVPDVVRPRWARALTKTVVAVAGAVLTFKATAEGREAQDAVRSVRDAVRDADGTPADGTPADGTPADEPAAHDGPATLPPAVLALAGVGAVAASAALTVAGERWVYRRGESLRRRGARLPHTRVGLVMAALAVALTAVEPLLRPDDEGEDAG